ncbi:helix-turn-helix domain-containing protein [Paenibacillus polymyxa]|uniref:helix-turn-helix domain-containing protein n=1 Tax=Paenibacillus polymyxa TaxID=1406 RepID=UPI003D26A171
MFEVGKRIRQHRKAARLTQERMGELLSIDPSYLGRIERGEINTTLDMIFRIAEALKISPYELFISTNNVGISEKYELIEKIDTMLLNLHTDDLKTIYRIMKDTVSLIKK